MHRADIFRSTPFRLALTFGLAFVSAFLMAGLVTYHLLASALSQQLDGSVNGTYSVVASTYAPNDVEDLIAAVDAYARLRSLDHSVFSLEDKNGVRLAGNFTAPALSQGLSTVDAATLGLADGSDYRIRAGTVGDNHLVVGKSFAETDRLAQILLVSFGWAAAVVVLIAIGGGAFLATRAQRRLDAVARTMIDVSNGHLSTRIPLRGNGDDIDVVSARINDALDRLSALVEGMRQVSSDIAHELKTPLNRLKMTLDHAGERDELGAPIGSLIAEALAESDQINATFEALLRISQIEAGARKTRFRPIDLREIMCSIADIYGDVAEDAGQTLRLAGPQESAVMVMGDAELLTQMFVNLVENAINHGPKGTVIAMSLRREGQSAIAMVADNGAGIPIEEQENVFRRLYRLDKSRTNPGSGLGLSLVRAIADLHSVDLTLGDNNPGVRISLTFPVC